VDLYIHSPIRLNVVVQGNFTLHLSVNEENVKMRGRGRGRNEVTVFFFQNKTQIKLTVICYPLLNDFILDTKKILWLKTNETYR
jgi:hypothetical protein